MTDKTCQQEFSEGNYCDISESERNPLSENSDMILVDGTTANADDICQNNPCVLITGDTQYPRTKDSIDEKTKAKNQLTAYFNAIKLFGDAKGKNFLGMIINGDITEYGHPSERDVMKDLFADLGHPIWYGLGNHDYGGGQDCWMDRCTSGSIQDLVDNVITEHDNILSSDHAVEDINEFPTIVRHFIGSFAYSFELAGVIFIQTNFNDTYKFKKDNIFNAGLAKSTNVDIQPSSLWVKGQLESAYQQEKPTILLSHDSERSDFLTAHSIRNHLSAHFFGHWHGDPEVIRDYGCSSFGGDTILSGTAFEGSGIILEIDKDNNKFYSYAFYKNDLSQFVLLKTTEMK